MSPRKLSDDDRQEILELYCQTEETTSSLSTRFGVSSSTISRFLKSSLSKTEYEDLIQAKRLARTSRNDEEKTTKKSSAKSTIKKAKIEQIKAKTIDKTEQLQLDVESKPQDDNTQEDLALQWPTTLENGVDDLLGVEIIEDDDLPLNDDIEETIEDTNTETVVIEDSNPDLEIDEEPEDDELESVQEVAAMFGEDMDDDEDDDDEDEDEDDEDEDEDELIKETTLLEKQLQVLSLNDAIFPRVCYLVIDRYSELVTKPMKDFAHLGSIPNDETQQQTLPIFDNHKVAKRFCVRKGKVIKVPDGRVLQKTSNYLQAKGISRILMDGKVYAIVN